jgi:chromosome partitioning protein
VTKIIAIISRKGGVGKSTVCSNLAVASESATIVDCDDQATLADWGDRRNKSPQVLTSPPKRAAKVAAGIGTDYVLIDTAGQLDADVIEVMSEADFILVVLRFSQFDLDSIGTSLAAAKSTGKNFAVVINHLHPTADAVTVLKALADLNCPVCPVVLRQRADYQSAAVEGLGVTELSPQGKAADEVSRLWAWLEKQMNV